jgi:hypothetical protein
MESLIKIMPDYGCFPLWKRNKESEIFQNINHLDLNISNEIKIKLDEWNLVYQNTFNNDYPPNSSFINLKAAFDFEKEGLLIWKQLIDETEEQIVYYSVMMNAIYVSPLSFNDVLNNVGSVSD